MRCFSHLKTTVKSTNIHWFLSSPSSTSILSSSFMSDKQPCCMVMKINLDCSACCRKARRVLLNIKEIETHLIERQQGRVVACGRFRPSDVAIKLRKKMNRRVEILEIQEFDDNTAQ